MPLLALDDTDTRHGGCTTHTAYRIACALDDADGALAQWGLTGPARLVRLDPAAPHRTRGNGALVLPIGPRDAAAPAHIVGRHPDGRPLLVRADAPEPLRDEAVDALAALVGRHLPPAAPDGADPQPGAVFLPAAPDAALYRTAVARMVAAAAAWRMAPAGTVRLTAHARRGETGALAAAAWSPLDEGRWTWECIGYRGEDEHAPERRLPPRFAEQVLAISGAFDNVDAATGRTRAVPRTPCPVRFGVRGLDPEALLTSLDPLLCADGEGGWLVQTNHATGDHARYAPSRAEPHAVARATVTINGPPRRGPGGHLFAAAQDDIGALTLAAYEPTKTLRTALGRCAPGDVLEVLARSGADARTLAVEAFRVVAVALRSAPGPNPTCPGCGRATHSAGRGAGYRCRSCHLRLPLATRATHALAAPFTAGDHFQVPDHVRGHLLPPRDGLACALGFGGEPSSHPIAPVFGPVLRVPVAT